MRPIISAWDVEILAGSKVKLAIPRWLWFAGLSKVRLQPNIGEGFQCIHHGSDYVDCSCDLDDEPRSSIPSQSTLC